ncbi:MAG: signal peptidase I [Limisphaerales bacterium]
MGTEIALRTAGWIRTVVVGRKPAWTLARIVILVTTVFVLLKYVVLIRKIESTSMLPRFPEGSIHVIYRHAYAGSRGPDRGDVVGVKTSGETVMYVKRVVGLPGETIEIRSNEVRIDGRSLDEPYARWGRRRWDREAQRLGPDQYFVIGDNRSMAQEQHEFGVIQRRRIAGKVIW